MELEKELEGKYVFIRLKTGKIITGTVKSYDNQLIKMLDKFNMIVFIFEKEIEFLEVQR